MKKIMTLCLFAFVMVLGSQSVMAQSLVEVNAIAAKKTAELHKVIKFNSETHDLVYQAFQGYEQKKYNLDKMESAGDNVQEESKKLNMAFEAKMKSILTTEQFERYLKYKQPK